MAESGGDGEAHAVAVGLYPAGIHDERRRDRAFALGVEAAELVIFLNCLGMLHWRSRPFHRRKRSLQARGCSGGEFLAALGAATVDQSAACAGAHALTETVLHVTTTVVRLECPLHN